MDSIQIIVPTSTGELSSVRHILRRYGNLRQNDEALGDFKGEMANLPGIYSPPGGCLLLARFDEKPAGCVAYRKVDDTTCEMKRLFVLPRFQGNGIGRRLVDKLIESARKRGYKKMLLDTHPWMDKAQQLYEQFGFKEVKPYHYNPTPGIRFFALEL